MGETLKGFKPIYGTTKGQSEEAAFQELYPFLFCLQQMIVIYKFS